MLDRRGMIFGFRKSGLRNSKHSSLIALVENVSEKRPENVSINDRTKRLVWNSDLNAQPDVIRFTDAITALERLQEFELAVALGEIWAKTLAKTVLENDSRNLSQK